LVGRALAFDEIATEVRAGRLRKLGAVVGIIEYLTDPRLANLAD